MIIKLLKYFRLTNDLRAGFSNADLSHGLLTVDVSPLGFQFGAEN